MHAYLGPGQCSITCPPSSITWIAAPIILGVVFLVLLGLLIWRLHKTGRISCQVYASLYHPISVKMPPSPLVVARANQNRQRVGPVSMASTGAGENTTMLSGNHVSAVTTQPPSHQAPNSAVVSFRKSDISWASPPFHSYFPFKFSFLSFFPFLAIHPFFLRCR